MSTLILTVGTRWWFGTAVRVAFLVGIFLPERWRGRWVDLFVDHVISRAIWVR